ncbi:hypothetical protein AMS68_006813 [Peltaster fructicola]|uniref:Uncharacterized protein n=1 Tax=Peltaster fructicola TaxID=286661 RepID=A0A6H0Y2X1_9PEZI|nr:hypothetical protein AMS68_006813 [Peltaster fructicola]
MKVATVVAIMAFTAAQAAAVAEADPRWKIWSSCGPPGITCAKTKRAALAVAEALAEFEPHRAHSSTCNFPGAKCHNARRSIEQLGAATESTLDNVLALDKDDDAIAYKDKLLHAGFPSTKRTAKRDAEINARWKIWSSCGPPGITCAKAKRGIDLIKEDFPDIHKEECFAKGGECHAVLKARAAFDAAVKREEGADISSCGQPGFTCAQDVYDYAAAKLKRDPAADKADEECNGPEGDCTKAQTYFDELDAALTKAQEDVLKDN